jgi:hypothetical protein
LGRTLKLVRLPSRLAEKLAFRVGRGFIPGINVVIREAFRPGGAVFAGANGKTYLRA